MDVKVWNDGDYDWKETFKGDPVSIKAKEFITMERQDAIEFRGQYYPPKIMSDDTQDPKSYKRIRIEIPLDVSPEQDEGMEVFMCQACKRAFTTDALLVKHSESEHADRAIVVDAVAEKEAMKRKSNYKFGPQEEA